MTVIGDWLNIRRHGQRLSWERALRRHGQHLHALQCRRAEVGAIAFQLCNVLSAATDAICGFSRKEAALNSADLTKWDTTCDEVKMKTSIGEMFQRVDRLLISLDVEIRTLGGKPGTDIVTEGGAEVRAGSFSGGEFTIGHVQFRLAPKQIALRRTALPTFIILRSRVFRRTGRTTRSRRGARGARSPSGEDGGGDGDGDSDSDDSDSVTAAALTACRLLFFGRLWTHRRKCVCNRLFASVGGGVYAP